MDFYVYICTMKENLEEIWEDVPNYKGLYQISSFGRARSLPREWVSGRGTRRKHNGKILKQSKNGRGYYHVTLSKEGKVKTKKIHQLVAMAFLGHKPDDHLVCDHINNDKLNNRVSNLQLITQRENTSKDKIGYTSKYTGVSWSKKLSKWCSNIRINGQCIHLGYFDNEEEAGEMYQLALSNIDKYDGDSKSFRDYLKSIS